MNEEEAFMRAYKGGGGGTSKRGKTLWLVMRAPNNFLIKRAPPAANLDRNLYP
jgi:hypothetical protein